VDNTQVSQLKLQGKGTEPAQKPLIQIMVEVCNHAKGGSLFQSGCQGIQAVVVDHVMGAFSSKRKAPTNTQPCFQAGSTSKKLSQSFQTVYIVRALVACCRWCCGLYLGGVLHLSGQYLQISWVHKQGDYAARI
jgi:ribonuclease PH